MIETHRECRSWETLVPKSVKSEFLFIDKLSIAPILLSLTIKNLQLEENGSFVANFLKNSLGKALANFNQAPIKLAGIQLQKVFGTNATVIGTLHQRYKTLTSETVMGVVLSSNLIGNPKQLFNKISSGFVDLVEKPKQGFLEGPLQGSIGIIDGAGSLATKTVGATFSTLHNITDSLATGLFALAGVPQDFYP
jgi:vacuolar protein sorting-associated protein 13A/C